MIMLCLIRYLAVSLFFFNPHNPGFAKVDKLYTSNTLDVHTHIQDKGFLSAIQMSTLVFCVQSIVLCSGDHILLGISGS